VAGTNRSLLVNDEDAEDGILTAFLVDAPSHGTLDLRPDGTFTYTHNGSNNLTDSFTYKVSDGESESEAVTVTIQVLGGAEVESTDTFLYLPVMQK